MNISAVNCTPIKPQVTFGMAESQQAEYQKFLEGTDSVYNTYCQGPNVKKPLAIIGSIALAGVAAFTFGSKAASFISTTFPKIVNPAESKYFENYIKKGADKVIKFGKDLATKEGKFAKVTGLASKGVAEAEKAARKGYKAITSLGTKNLTSDIDIATKKFRNLLGAVSVAAFIPSICSSDANEDGVKDICQRGQNAYTGTKNQINHTIERANGLGKLLDLFT